MTKCAAASGVKTQKCAKKYEVALIPVHLLLRVEHFVERRQMAGRLLAIFEDRDEVSILRVFSFGQRQRRSAMVGECEDEGRLLAVTGGTKSGRSLSVRRSARVVSTSPSRCSAAIVVIVPKDIPVAVWPCHLCL